MHRFLPVCYCLSLLFFFGCQTPQPHETTQTDFEHLEPEGLPHTLKLTEKIYSGGQPTPQGFESLEKQGIKTVISVDGARPDVETARKHGLRYIHLPMGYDSVPPEVAAGLAKAVKESPGPVYIHCHHGRHRGPAAAAVAYLSQTGLSGALGCKVLEEAGTGKKYEGLWRDVARFDQDKIKGVKVDLVEIAKVDSFTARMAEIDRIWDRLRYAQLAGWKQPPDHPDVAPPHEAMILMEHFRESNRLENVAWPQDFAQGLKRSEKLAEDLRRAILARDRLRADALFSEISDSCNSCHASYRNTPEMVMD